MERIWHHNKPAKRGLPIKREATKRPKRTLKELQSSTAGIGVSVQRTTLSHTLNRAGLYGRVARKKPLLILVFAKRLVGVSPFIWKMVLWSDETKIVAIKENAMSGANPTPLITLTTPSPQWSVVVAASCYGDVFHRQGLGNWSELMEWWTALNTGKFLRETCFSLPEIWDWDGGSPSSRTMTLSIVLKQHSSGLRGNI